MTNTANHNTAISKAASVRLMIFDVDGVLTPGNLQFDATGEVIKSFNVLDGQGIRLLEEAGITTAIISARQSPIVAKRAKDLGIMHLMQGIHDKKTAFITLSESLAITPMHCGFVGDDVIDLPVLTRVGFSASVANGHHEVRTRVDYVTQARGGHGAVRELCDFILRAQDKYDQILKRFLS
jgi:3-deoxy-D-manno-octulosonate 8-phosphate phosphatase (KDO 8-P phosphatase)